MATHREDDGFAARESLREMRFGVRVFLPRDVRESGETVRGGRARLFFKNVAAEHEHGFVGALVESGFGLRGQLGGREAFERDRSFQRLARRGRQFERRRGVAGRVHLDAARARREVERFGVERTHALFIDTHTCSRDVDADGELRGNRLERQRRPRVAHRRD